MADVGRISSIHSLLEFDPAKGSVCIYAKYLVDISSYVRHFLSPRSSQEVDLVTPRLSIHRGETGGI